MDTIEEEAPVGRRYSREFKAQVVAAGVSIAAIALHHKLNANLLRRWVDQAEGNVPASIIGGAVAVQPAATPACVPVPFETRNAVVSGVLYVNLASYYIKSVRSSLTNRGVGARWITGERPRCAAARARADASGRADEDDDACRADAARPARSGTAAHCSTCTGTGTGSSDTVAFAGRRGRLTDHRPLKHPRRSSTLWRRRPGPHQPHKPRRLYRPRHPPRARVARTERRPRSAAR